MNSAWRRYWYRCTKCQSCVTECTLRFIWSALCARVHINLLPWAKKRKEKRTRWKNRLDHVFITSLSRFNGPHVRKCTQQRHSVSTAFCAYQSPGFTARYMRTAQVLVLPTVNWLMIFNDWASCQRTPTYIHTPKQHGAGTPAFGALWSSPKWNLYKTPLLLRPNPLGHS